MSHSQHPWHDVGEPDDFPDQAVWPVRAGDTELAVFRLGDQLHALHDRCTHGLARLSDGYVEDGCVECPLHQGLFDIATGEPRCAPVTEAVRRFPVRVVAGRVQVCLEEVTLTAVLNAPAAPTASATEPRRGWRLPADAGWTLASVLTLIGLWSLAAWSLPSSVLPSPWLVLQAMGDLALTDELWSDIAITLGRIGMAFAIGMGAALALGSAMAMSRSAGVFFRVWIVCGITMPAIVTILTVYMVVGMNDRGAVLGAALTVIPFLAINVREGLKGIDTKLVQMASVFRASRGQMVFAVIAPQVAPMLLASARFGLGLVWKMVLFVELLGRGDGVGFRIEYYFQLFDMSSVLAYAMCFVLVMLAIEVGVFGVLEKRAFRWRQA